MNLLSIILAKSGWEELIPLLVIAGLAILGRVGKILENRSRSSGQRPPESANQPPRQRTYSRKAPMFPTMQAPAKAAPPRVQPPRAPMPPGARPTIQAAPSMKPRATDMEAMTSKGMAQTAPRAARPTIQAAPSMKPQATDMEAMMSKGMAQTSRPVAAPARRPQARPVAPRTPVRPPADVIRPEPSVEDRTFDESGLGAGVHTEVENLTRHVEVEDLQRASYLEAPRVLVSRLTGKVVIDTHQEIHVLVDLSRHREAIKAIVYSEIIGPCRALRQDEIWDR